MKVTVNEIGDGLFLDIRFKHSRLVTDFGSQQNIPIESLYRFLGNFPFSFALSHFHSDHYKGLVEFAQQGGKTPIDKVYFPRLPQFSDRPRLLKAFQAINFYLMGNDSGSIKLLPIGRTINAAS